MAVNKINKYGLESKAVALKKEGMFFNEIASALSIDSNKQISVSSVQRFFASRESDKIEAAQKSDKLKTKLVEAEIDTIAEAMYCVDTLKEVVEEAKQAKDYKTLMQAIDRIYPGLNQVNQILDKYKSTTSPVFNAVSVFYSPEVVSAANELSKRLTEKAMHTEDLQNG